MPTPVDALANSLLGEHEQTPPLPAAVDEPVLAVLERPILAALQRPPCFVSFSGGRDSSAVLAVAVDVARRHGLPDPVPATMRFPGASGTDETSWQELVLAHLGLHDHVVVSLSDELDLLGTAATAFLRRHGVRWPANAYMHRPLLEAAGGGSLLTGAGGDELFATRASRLVFVTRRRARPRWSDACLLGAAALPARLRATRGRARYAAGWTWLTPAGRKVLGRALALDDARWPARWDRSVRHWYRSRAFVGVDRAVPTVAESTDVVVSNPFLDPRVLAELARVGGPTGFESRTAAMRQLFGSLLPDPVLSRGSKAVFSGATWGPAVRAFAADWKGEGVDRRHVDVDALRRCWLSPEPDFRTALLLHGAWLAREGADSQPNASRS